MNDIESDYLHLLVDLDRAGNHKYQEKLKRKIEDLQKQSRNIAKRVPHHIELNDEQKAIYYSSWLFAGIRNLTAIPNCNNVDEISKYLKIETSVAVRIIRFLLDNGLCKNDDNGHFTYGPSAIHINKDSPFVNKHHQNWRLQAIQHMENKNDDDLFFTSPMSLSHTAIDEIRKMLPTFIQNVIKISSNSTSELVACLNIDWFKY